MHWGDEKTIVWLLLLFEARVTLSALSKFRPRWLRQTQNDSRLGSRLASGEPRHRTASFFCSADEISRNVWEDTTCALMQDIPLRWKKRFAQCCLESRDDDLALPNSWGLSQVGLVKSGLCSNKFIFEHEIWRNCCKDLRHLFRGEMYFIRVYICETFVWKSLKCNDSLPTTNMYWTNY